MSTMVRTATGTRTVINTGGVFTGVSAAKQNKSVNYCAQCMLIDKNANETAKTTVDNREPYYCYLLLMTITGERTTLNVQLEQKKKPRLLRVQKS